MSAPKDLVLRDIHVPAAPSLWPPAPGWWIVAAAVIATIALVLWYRARQRRRREAMLTLFDETVTAAVGAPAKIAAISELLRRASRRRNANADRLDGEDWLCFLDAGIRGTAFTAGPGRLLLDGGFRPQVGTAELEALRNVARAAFLRLMEARR
jgi:hypothetical protein